jgi:hypothetical protein
MGESEGPSMDGRLPDFRQARFNSGRKSESLAGNGRLIAVRFGGYFLDESALGRLENARWRDFA